MPPPLESPYKNDRDVEQRRRRWQVLQFLTVASVVALFFVMAL